MLWQVRPPSGGLPACPAYRQAGGAKRAEVKEYLIKTEHMETEKGKTYKYLREKRVVSQVAKDNMKQFSKVKKAIMDALKEGDMTVDQMAKKINMPKDELMFYLMSLLKYGHVQTGALDDMDEYFSYKLKK